MYGDPSGTINQCNSSRVPDFQIPQHGGDHASNPHTTGNPAPAIHFAGAHHFGIGTFKNTTQNVTNFNQFTSAHSPLKILHDAVAFEAMPTSKTASYAPKCNPKTRKKIIADILELVDAAEKPMIWFHGPAGGGKTCIMREVVKRCQESGWLTCTFFFYTRVAGLDAAEPFVATIVHQLTKAVPELQPIFAGILSRNPTIFQESLDFQIDTLFTAVLASDQFLSISPSPMKIVLIIDGFDECRDVAEREHLLDLLGALDNSVPQTIIIIIASRPELDIRTTFDAPQFLPTTHILRLQDYNGAEDVLIYFCDEFERIRQTHPMKKKIPADWPVERTLHILVYKSSGHFILPSTIIKYISNPRRNPVEMLEKVLAASSGSVGGNENPLEELDAIYNVILHPPETDIALMKRILHCVIASSSIGTWNRMNCPHFLENLLRLPSGIIETTLCDLHSIINVPSDDDEKMTFHHKSLEDYLLSPSRSGDLFQARSDTFIDLTLVCIQLLEEWASNPGPITAFAGPQATLGFALSMLHEFLTQTLEGKLPNRILEFDSRIAARLSLIAGDHTNSSAKIEQEIAYMDKARKLFHSVMCKQDSCFPLCRHISRIRQCTPQINSYESLSAQFRSQVKFAALPRVDMETGLYDEDEIDDLTYPAGRGLLAFELEQMCMAHPLRSSIPKDWPFKARIREMTVLGGGDLSLASLVTRYTNHPRRSPVEMLDNAFSAILASTDRDGDPNAYLDAMYTLILHPPGVNLPLMKRLLHLIIGADMNDSPTKFTGSIFSVFKPIADSRTISNTLGELSSVLYVLSSDYMLFQAVIFYEKTTYLEEYLLSPDRSKDFYQAPYETSLDFTALCIHHVQEWSAAPRSIAKTEALGYATHHWLRRFSDFLGSNNHTGQGSPHIPPSILEFDPRQIWRASLLLGELRLLERYTHDRQNWCRTQEQFHRLMCPSNGSNCLPLCKILDHILQGRRFERVVALIRLRKGSIGQRQARQHLHNFDMDTGLYDEDEVDGLSYPVGRRLLALEDSDQAQESSDQGAT